MRSRAALAVSVLSFALAASAPAAQAAWHVLGSTATTSGVNDQPSTADVGGAPWVASVAGDDGGGPGLSELQVKRWDGSSWILEGGPLNVDTAGAAAGASIANIGGIAYVAWFEEDGTGPD